MSRIYNKIQRREEKEDGLAMNGLPKTCAEERFHAGSSVGVTTLPISRLSKKHRREKASLVRV